MILASVPEFDARFGWLFTSIEVTAVVAFALEYLARLWSVVGHSLRAVTPVRARLEYAFSSLGIIDLMAFLPSAIALTVGDRHALVLFGMLPFSNWCAIRRPCVRCWRRSMPSAVRCSAAS